MTLRDIDAGQATLQIRNRIAVVPMEHAETYVEHEILSEGRWASGRQLIIVRPSQDAGAAAGHWWPRTLERMRDARRRKGTLPLTVDTAGGPPMQIDIGLVDVTVFFQMPPGVPPLPASRAEYDMTLTENFRHFDSLCSGALHDQMIVATVLHSFHSNGTRLLHYHNLIFGLRQEVRGDMDILGPLDMHPVLKALSRSGPVNIISGKRP
jgi:hypothetical protein